MTIMYVDGMTFIIKLNTGFYPVKIHTALLIAPRKSNIGKLC